jgi:Tfp pilus assembly protein PilO
MSARTRLVLVIVGVLAVCAVFFFMFIKGRQAELGKVRQQVTEEENRTQELESRLARLEQLQKNAPQLEAKLAEMREFVPERNDVPNFIFQVQQAASQAGVRFVKVTPELPKQPPEGASLAEVRAVIGASGTYFAIQDFVRRVYALDRAARFDSLTVIVNEDENAPEGELTLESTARVFFELPAGGAAAATTTTETTTITPTTPAASPAPATP